MKIIERQKFDSIDTVRLVHDGMNFIVSESAAMSDVPQLIGSCVDALGTLQLVFSNSLYGVLIKNAIGI